MLQWHVTEGAIWLQWTSGETSMTTHRESRIPGNREYRSWTAMRQRCACPTDPAYPRYGGRGITFCQGFDTYEHFRETMGSRPIDKTLDRINNEFGYFCGRCAECRRLGRVLNVRWSTRIQQQRNKRDNHLLTAFGRTMTIAEWAEETGLIHQTINMRLTRGWSEERAVATGV